MVRAATPFAGGGTAADDIVQLASLEALSRVEDLTTIGVPAAWLAGVARNVGLRVYRKRKRRARLRKEWSRNEDETLADAHRRIVLSWSVDGIDSRRELVLEAAHELSEPLREVVVAMLDDMSDEEIATRCGVAVSTVRVRRHRAIRAVQQVFSGGGRITPSGVLRNPSMSIILIVCEQRFHPPFRGWWPVSSPRLSTRSFAPTAPPQGPRRGPGHSGSLHRSC